MALVPVEETPVLIDRFKAIAYFIDRGWVPPQAFAIVAVMEQQSGLNTVAKGRKNEFGLMLWPVEKLEVFREVYGKPMHEAPVEDQLAFTHWMLTSDDYRNDPALKRAGDNLRQTRGAHEAGSLLGRLIARSMSRAAGSADKCGEVASRWHQEAIASATQGI